MGTKLNPGTYDCYAAALPNEPMFILLARDEHAPTLVRTWAGNRRYAIQRGVKPATDMAMVEEAMECAAAMETWRALNHGRWRVRDPMSAFARVEAFQAAVIALDNATNDDFRADAMAELRKLAGIGS